MPSGLWHFALPVGVCSLADNNNNNNNNNNIYLYISMYIQAEYRRLGVIIFILLFPVPVISFLLLRVVLLRLRVTEEFLFISARRRAYHL